MSKKRGPALVPDISTSEKRMNKYTRLKNFIIVTQFNPIGEDKISYFYRIDDPSIKYIPRFQMTVNQARQRDHNCTLMASLERMRKKYVIEEAEEYDDYEQQYLNGEKHVVFESDDLADVIPVLLKYKSEDLETPVSCTYVWFNGELVEDFDNAIQKYFS